MPSCVKILTAHCLRDSRECNWQCRCIVFRSRISLYTYRKDDCTFVKEGQIECVKVEEHVSINTPPDRRVRFSVPGRSALSDCHAEDKPWHSQEHASHRAHEKATAEYLQNTFMSDAFRRIVRHAGNMVGGALKLSLAALSAGQRWLGYA